jgi:hypothetical protein
MTIEEFKRAAEKAFATNYDIDARLMLSRVFVRGSMTKETFGKVYREIASAQYPVELERPPGAWRAFAGRTVSHDCLAAGGGERRPSLRS